ncbi:hypothetical protein L9F63_020460, partial [Diploptera punctata]
SRMTQYIFFYITCNNSFQIETQAIEKACVCEKLGIFSKYLIKFYKLLPEKFLEASSTLLI